MSDLSKPPKVPCGTCPYRKDVPSGIWAPEEYLKLPQYDGETFDQVRSGGTALFMCHQRDGCLCGGWLTTHDPRHLLALRLHQVDPAAFDYRHDIPCFASGAEAAAHGLSGVAEPSPAARRKMDGLIRQRNGKA